MKRLIIIISGILLVLLIIVSVIALSHHERRKKITSTFDKVQLGDTKQSVEQMLGQPEEVQNCLDLRSNEEPTKRCVETYWYMTFLERWGFSFNKDEKVIDKTHNVSF